MSKEIENPFAFPTTEDNNKSGSRVMRSSGMLLRDYFAGQALMSLLATPQDIDDETSKIAAKMSYAFADAMLKERSK